MSQQADLLSPAPCPFIFRDHQIRTVSENDQLWFVAKDVCAALDISWSSATLKPIPREWQGVMSFITPSGNQRLKTISEPAVYKLAFRSNKPDADAFTNWIAAEVVPSIRKTGAYSVAPPPPQPRLSTVEDRAPLNRLVDTWVSLAPITKRQAWEMIHVHFNIEGIRFLAPEEVLIVMNFVQARIDALPKELPAPPASRIYNDPATVATALSQMADKVWRAADELQKLMEKTADDAEKTFRSPQRLGNVANRTDLLLSEHRRIMRDQARNMFDQCQSFWGHLNILAKLAPILHEPEGVTKTDLRRV